MDFKSILREKKYALFQVNTSNRIALSFMNGCSYNCKYCRPRVAALTAGKKTAENWTREEIDPALLQQQFQPNSGVYIFPATHDINPSNLETAIMILGRILKAGNRVIITTKPYLGAIQKICDSFASYKTQLLFRFSIGSVNSAVLKYWEPGAPDYNGRLEALKWAFYGGFNTGVTCEPMLDKRVEELIEAVLPYVTETMRLGGFQAVLEAVKKDPACNEELIFQAQQLLEWQSGEGLWRIYQRYRNNPQVKWDETPFDSVKVFEAVNSF